MTSPKKKKGQQRKAAKNQAMANYGVSSSRELAAKIEAETKFVEDVGKARNVQTRGLTLDINDMNHSSTLTLSGMLEQVPGQVHKRALPHILNFLKRCEQETFDQVVASVGGDLVRPVTWIEVLIKVVEYEPGCSLQIAESIGPLVSRMVNDTDCLLFKSNKHWTEGIRYFVWLIHDMVSSSMEDKEVLSTLLQHDGLLESIIQWSFWADHRPDLVEDLGDAACEFVVTFGKNITRLLVNSIYQRRNDEAIQQKNWLEKVGCTPIVNKAYDPTCMVSYVEGMVQQMKTNEFDGSDLQTFSQLTIGIDCVDKGVITETIDLGVNFATDYKCAFSLALILLPIMRQGTSTTDLSLNDSRIAFAIRAGLIEMYLCFIGRFGENELFADDSGLVDIGMTSSLYSTIRLLINDIHLIALHQKTSKAIRSKRGSIEEELVRLQLNTSISITNNIKCRELLDMVSSILNLSGSYCCRCNKSLSKTEVMQCNGCHCMSYCSRSCQKDDWMNDGHKVSCCKSFTNELAGRFQGRLAPDSTPENERAAVKLKELETNLNMIQLKLLIDNSNTILSQASSFDIPLCDCMVNFDLRECPPTVDVKKYTDVYVTPEQLRRFEETRSKEEHHMYLLHILRWRFGR